MQARRHVTLRRRSKSGEDARSPRTRTRFGGSFSVQLRTIPRQRKAFACAGARYRACYEASGATGCLSAVERNNGHRRSDGGHRVSRRVIHPWRDDGRTNRHAFVHRVSGRRARLEAEARGSTFTLCAGVAGHPTARGRKARCSTSGGSTALCARTMVTSTFDATVPFVPGGGSEASLRRLTV